MLFHFDQLEGEEGTTNLDVNDIITYYEMDASTSNLDGTVNGAVTTASDIGNWAGDLGSVVTSELTGNTNPQTLTQSQGSTGAWEYVFHTGQTNNGADWSIDFMGQKFPAGHTLVGKVITEIEFDLSYNLSTGSTVPNEVLQLVKLDSSNAVTVLEDIPFSSLSTSGTGSGNSPNFTTETFNSFTPFVLQADDKLGIYLSGTLGGWSSDACSGACTYVEIALTQGETPEDAVSGENRFGQANSGVNFTTANTDMLGDVKYSIGYADPVYTDYRAEQYQSGTTSSVATEDITWANMVSAQDNGNGEVQTTCPSCAAWENWAESDKTWSASDGFTYTFTEKDFGGGGHGYNDSNMIGIRTSSGEPGTNHWTQIYTNTPTDTFGFMSENPNQRRIVCPSGVTNYDST